MQGALASVDVAGPLPCPVHAARVCAARFAVPRFTGLRFLLHVVRIRADRSPSSPSSPAAAASPTPATGARQAATATTRDQRRVSNRSNEGEHATHSRSCCRWTHRKAERLGRGCSSQRQVSSTLDERLAAHFSFTCCSFAVYHTFCRRDVQHVMQQRIIQLLSLLRCGRCGRRVFVAAHVSASRRVGWCELRL